LLRDEPREGIPLLISPLQAANITEHDTVCHFGNPVRSAARKRERNSPPLQHAIAERHEHPAEHAAQHALLTPRRIPLPRLRAHGSKSAAARKAAWLLTPRPAPPAPREQTPPGGTASGAGRTSPAERK